MTQIHLRGSVGDRLPEDDTPRPSVEVHATGQTYEEAYAALEREVPEGRLLLSLTRV